MSIIYHHLPLFLMRTCLLLIVISATSSIASAQNPPLGIPANLELDGYAWSSNIGWISLNCRTGGLNQEDICATSNYRVRVNSNGTFATSSYAWSPNIGWIRFNAVNNMNNHTVFPAGGGTTPTEARFVGTYPNLTLQGWARVCSATASIAGLCNNAAISTTSGGWDGWISLNGNGYGVNTQNFGTPQYVWGGSVVGWIDMGSHVRWFSPSILSVPSCVVLAGNNSCTSTSTWQFSPSVPGPNRTIHRANAINTGNILTNAPLTNTPSTQNLTLFLGTNTLTLRNNVSVLATATTTVACAPGLWQHENRCHAASTLQPISNCTVAEGQSTCNTDVSWTIPASITNPNLHRVTPSPSTISSNQTGTIPVSLNLGSNQFQLRSGTTVIPNTTRIATASCGADLTQTTESVCRLTPVARPNITISVNPTILRRGGTSTVTISSSLALTPNHRCSVRGGGINESNIIGSSVTLTTSPIMNSTTITVNCTGSFPDAPLTTTAFINVIPSVSEI